MVNSCAVLNCHNRADKQKDKSFYRIPRPITNQGEECLKLSEKRRRAWLSSLSLELDGKSIDNMRVCSDHFITEKPSSLYDHTNPDWVPSQKMGITHHVEPSSSATFERYERVKSRSGKKRNLHCAFNAVADDLDEVMAVELYNAEPTQTEMTGELLNTINHEMARLKAEIISLQSQLCGKNYNLIYFSGNNIKVKFYTGLNTFVLLQTLFTFMEPFMPSKLLLSKENILIMTLMKLRLNLSLQDLAYRFEISTSSVCRYFTETVSILYNCLQHLIIWPDREALRKTMPMEFRKHFGKKIAVIIDCFEVFIDRPSNLEARAQTWSSYKHHNTVKYLIGITPQGSVSFISDGWGGRVSDKYLTEHSGFLEKLLPGDLILADRGFDINELVGLNCPYAEVKIPSFTRGKNQLAPTDVETTRKIAHVRIHVERVIGCVRQKYTILSSTIPVDFLTCKEEGDLPLLDKICKVCCCLTNLCPSVIQFN